MKDKTGVAPNPTEQKPVPEQESGSKTRKRRVLSFPVMPVDQPLELARALFANGSGQAVRRLTLFDAIGKAPESGPSRSLIASASKYRLILGSAASDNLELMDIGRKIVDDSFPPRERALAKVESAVKSVPAFAGLYEKFKGNKLPTKPVLVDSIQEFDITKDEAEQAVDIFLENLNAAELLQTLSGAQRIIGEDHLADIVSQKVGAAQVDAPAFRPQMFAPPITGRQAAFETTAFYITPIGSEGSPQRRHSDLFLNTLVEPAAESLGLRVVRADAIDKPGIITRQIVQYLVESRLVIADLSFHNPNVFYELAVRHMVRKPVVQLIQKSDHVPFDVNQLRTIVIDNSDIYSWTPKLELWKSEIANQIRQVLEDPASVDSPINWYFTNKDE